MKGKKELVQAIRAGYSFFYARTQELERTILEIQDAVLNDPAHQGDKAYKLLLWDYEENSNAEAMLFETLEQAETRMVMVAKNYNWFMVDDFNKFNKLYTTYLQNRLEVFPTKDDRKVLIIVSDAPFQSAIPEVLQRQFLNIEFGLPEIKEIEEVYKYIVESAKEGKGYTDPGEEEVDRICNTAKGMSKQEIQNAFAYSYIEDNGTISSKTVAGIRARNIESAAGLQVCGYDRGFETLMGLDNIKDFTKLTIGHPNSLGIILIGPPGTGKTHFATCLAKETGLLMLKGEMAQLFGQYVGDTERLVGKFIEIVAANCPCILFIDEIEKALAGVGGSVGGDNIQMGGSEVTQRAMAQFLKFLSDERPEGLYVIATCNNIEALPPEWIRAERWDCAPFYISLPNDEEKELILANYQAEYNVEGRPSDMNGWSGAEIKAVCRISSMMDRPIDKVDKFVIPISKTMDKEIRRLEKWAENRTIPATMKVNNGVIAKPQRKLALD